MKSNTQISLVESFKYIKANCSLEDFLYQIKDEKYKSEIDQIRKHVQAKDKEAVNRLKSNLPAYTISGTFKKTRSASNLEQYSHHIVLDVDNISEGDLDRKLSIARLAHYTKASFVSPSGNGIKIIAEVDTDSNNHTKAYNQLKEHYENALEIEIDSSGKDIPRLCFVSADKNIYINQNAEVFKVDLNIPEQNTVTTSKSKKSTNIEDYISEIEATATDITGNYENWRNLGFAISEEYGEFGRAYYHRISKFYITYNYQECDLQYTNCLDAKGTGVNISTFYYVAHKNNIRPYAEPIEEEVLSKKDEAKQVANSDSPTFSTSLIPQLPQFLQNVLKYSKTAQEKDLMTLGTITTISACLPNVYGIYDGDKIYPNLYLFVSAPAASGKGKVKFCKRLVNRIHDSMQEEAKLMKEEYENQLAVYNKNKGKDESMKKPNKPPLKMLFIPANNSSSGMFQLLYENKGKGLIFETEADTLAKNFTKDYGDYSDGFRNAFHHESISYYRKTEKEYVEIKEPCLSCVLTGTPKQVLALMPNAENGLFSRFMFYKMPSSTKWRNVFEIKTKGGLNEYYDVLGNEFFELYKTLKSNQAICFSYTTEQQEAFLKFFPEINLYYLNINPIDYDASVKRLGIIAFRISMILTILRILETGDISNTLYCTDEDFATTLTMVKVLIKHSSKVYSSLPTDKTAINYKNSKEQFVESLPLRFTTQEYISCATKLDISQKSAERYITQLCRDNFLARISQGNYYNPSKRESEGNEESEGNK